VSNTTPSDDVKQLRDSLSDEADLCRNEGAVDIANLLDEARECIEALERAKAEAVTGERERCYDIVMRAPFEQPDMTQDDVDEFGGIEGAWEVSAKSMAFDICTKIRAAIASEAKP